MACFATEVMREDRDKLDVALIYDLSAGGALLLTRRAYAVGDRVTLAMYTTSSEESARSASGRVVRVERREHDRSDLWRHSAAVQFDAPLVGFEDDIAAVAAERAKRGLHPGA
ncbi:MAG: PilZ domain-containing protein [Myxococcales bacterium]|nr:PilZ domain-containing protein [Myxococcales bacterium]